MLDAVEHAFERSSRALVISCEARRHARARVSEVLKASGDVDQLQIATLGFATDIFASLVIELAARPAELREVIAEIEHVVRIPRLALARGALAAPQVLQLPVAVGIEVQLALLLAFAEMRTVSLWGSRSGGELKQIAHAGDLNGGVRHLRSFAGQLVAGTSNGSLGGSLAGVLVDRRDQPAAALIAQGARASSSERLLLLQSAVATLAGLLERDELLGRESTEQKAVAATERRLARLRFDIHDGPQQDIVMLAEDLRLFRRQLSDVIEDHPAKDRVLGRFDDLQARLVALDGELRRISATMQSPFMQSESLPDTLSDMAKAFADRTGIQPDLRLDGDFGHLTDSQQITLIGLIRESLCNIREHSDAEHVTIDLAAGSGGVKATVTDDGCGFDPESTLVKAAREGHLGLVGMHERVRLLGGQTRIDSQPGGPTIISVSLPSGPPAAPR